jgi:hypothetical protein
MNSVVGDLTPDEKERFKKFEKSHGASMTRILHKSKDRMMTLGMVGLAELKDTFKKLGIDISDLTGRDEMELTETMAKFATLGYLTGISEHDKELVELGRDVASAEELKAKMTPKEEEPKEKKIRKVQ